MSICLDIRSIGFFDDDNNCFVRLTKKDVLYNFNKAIDWKRIKPWAQNKDIIVDFSANNKRYAVSFVRHLLAQSFRPATLQVRDMDNLRFSIAIFDGRERIPLDQLELFRMDNGCVNAC